MQIAGSAVLAFMKWLGIVALLLLSEVACGPSVSPVAAPQPVTISGPDAVPNSADRGARGTDAGGPDPGRTQTAPPAMAPSPPSSCCTAVPGSAPASGSGRAA